jgi:hypothetical protein
MKNQQDVQLAWCRLYLTFCVICIQAPAGQQLTDDSLQAQEQQWHVLIFTPGLHQLQT